MTRSATGASRRKSSRPLAGITTPSICVRINSPGGDVFDGLAIYNALLAHDAKGTTCVVDGLAASAASFIALAGDTVSMHESAMMMVHRAWGLAIGNEADMTDMADRCWQDRRPARRHLRQADRQEGRRHAGHDGRRHPTAPGSRRRRPRRPAWSTRSSPAEDEAVGREEPQLARNRWRGGPASRPCAAASPWPNRTERQPRDGVRATRPALEQPPIPGGFFNGSSKGAIR
jgi:hypothetical protein